MVAISALAAVAVALFAAVPAFADVSLGEPEHSKTATLDPNTGKINITLSVTGNTDTSESKSSANLIVVLDTSESMNEGVDKKVSYVLDDSWYWWSERYGLVGDQYVSLSRERQGGFFDGKYIYYYTDNNGNDVEYTGQRYRKETTDVTRLDVAKSALDGLADQLISDEKSTVKISLETFADSGETPSRYYGAGEADAFKKLVDGQRAVGGTNWTDALEKANKKAKEDSSTPTYIVFLSDGEPTYGKNGTGNGTYTTEQFVTDAVNVANDRPSNVLGFYAIYTGADAATSMNNFASRTNASPNKQAIDGSNSQALQDAFKDIVTTIKTGISYTNVNITDTNSKYVDYVLPEGAPEGATSPEFTYKKNGETWAEAPKATLDNDQVSWNLGNIKLDKGVTYSVSFEVTLNQDAYDEAALGKLKDNQVPTNSAAQLAYSTVITTNGHDETAEQKPIDIPSPVVSVPVSSISVTKVWDPENAALTSATVKLQWKNADGDWEDVKDSNGDTRTLALNKGNEWTNVFNGIAAGPVGHEYQVVETNPSDANAWTTSYAYSVKENSYYDNETNKSKVNENDGSITLAGRKAQAASATVTNKQNTRKLTITKSVTGNFGDTSKAFSFKLTDASGSEIANVKKVTGDNGTSGGVSLGKDGAFTLKNGQRLVVELPYGASYMVVENDPKGTNDTVGYTTAITVGDSGAATDVNARKASSPDGGITKDTTITYTNKRDVTPDVGVDLGSGAPYAAIFGGAGLAGVIWMVLKRRNSLGI
ncbi:DUF7601 domain-containing protein [Parafannyhessea umbonata]|uniref:DUF7601 domain-containing protein n=1 Tax=Parafannyhessea umbonata TaxID=604330 RepID=UPI003AB35FC0